MMDLLAYREGGDEPYRWDYPTLMAYVQAWSLWCAIGRDSRPTIKEREVIFKVTAQKLAKDDRKRRRESRRG